MCKLCIFGRLLGMSYSKYILVCIGFHAVCAKWSTVERVIL